jgi:serine/threonine-protein kinase
MPPKDPFIGREILGGQFKVLEKIGTGGMGSVYKASQPAMNRMVAIKILHPKLAGRKDLTSRFRREARAMSQLTHPNTAKVFMYGEAEEDGSLYIVMEYLEGKNLNQTVRKEGPMPAERAIPILIQVCGALQEAHDLGIVHRDLKPENIFLSKQGGIQDFPKVLDFGLAKVTERQMQPGSVILTQEGMVFGTPEFMSPEQAQGRVLDARSDIYSLAVILYEVLTGKLPFSARTPMEYIQKHVMEPIIPLNERVPERKFSKGLEDVLARALKKKPDERYQSAAEFGEALRPFGGAMAASLPVIRVAGPQVVVEQPEFAGSEAPTVANPPKSGLGLLVGVAVACLLGGVIIAVIVMRAVGH